MPSTQYARPLDVPDLVDYLESVKMEYSDNPVAYSHFLHLIRDWCHGSLNIGNLIEEISILFRSKPRLLRDFNVLLSPNYRIECSTDVDSVTLLTVITPTGARIQTTTDSSLVPPSPCVTNTDELRSFLSSDHGWKELVNLEASWASCVLQLLQTDLDNQQIEPQYRKKCLRCLRALVQKSQVLPPSFFLRNIVREGEHPVWGGGFADIHRGRFNQQAVCFKVLRIFTTNHDREKLFKEFCHEAIVWRQLNHPNVLPFFGVSEELFAPSFCLVSPWMDHGNIMKYLEAHPEHDRLTSIAEIAEGLRYLHELTPNIIHGDIKGANILVTHDLHCCLGDFGLATIVESQLATTSAAVQGTIRWLAPELMNPNRFPGSDTQVKTASDIYAFGCTVLEIYTGEKPFSDHKLDITIMYDVLDGVRPHRPSPEVYLADETWALVQSCWEQQPQDRPTVWQVTQVLARLLNVPSDGVLALNANPPAVTSSLPASDPVQNMHVTSWLEQELQGQHLKSSNAIFASSRDTPNGAEPDHPNAINLLLRLAPRQSRQATSEDTAPTVNSRSRAEEGTNYPELVYKQSTADGHWKEKGDAGIEAQEGNCPDIIRDGDLLQDTDIDPSPLPFKAYELARTSLDVPSSPMPTDTSSNECCITVPPSPTLSSRSSVHFRTTLALRDNKPETRTGMISLSLLNPRDQSSSNTHNRKGSNASLSLSEGTEAAHPSHSDIDLRHVQSNTTSVTDVEPSRTRRRTTDFDTAFAVSTLRKKKIKGNAKEENPDHRLRVELPHDAHVDPTPFAFKPYELARMLDPKNLELLETLGGTQGLLRGLGTNPTRGLGKQSLLRTATVNAGEGERPGDGRPGAGGGAPQNHDPEKNEATTPAPDIVSMAPEGEGEKSVQEEGDEDENGPAFSGSLNQRRKIYGENVLPHRPRKKIWQLMFAARKTKFWYDHFRFRPPSLLIPFLETLDFAVNRCCCFTGFGHAEPADPAC